MGVFIVLAWGLHVEVDSEEISLIDDTYGFLSVATLYIYIYI